MVPATCELVSPIALPHLASPAGISLLHPLREVSAAPSVAVSELKLRGIIGILWDPAGSCESRRKRGVVFWWESGSVEAGDAFD